jgi:hypothetical protein
MMAWTGVTCGQTSAALCGGAFLLGLAGIDLLPVRQMLLEERHADQNLP